MLIVMYHIDHEFFNYLAPHLNDALQAFRLPMYYFISGIFFKLYSGYADFTRRKVNNILVPFVFFVAFAFAVRLLEYGFRLLVGAEPICHATVDQAVVGHFAGDGSVVGRGL